jgi:WXG100 family type VII secretion target
MPAPKVRGDYAELGKIAQGFEQAQDAVNKMLQSLKQNMETLHGGDWVGQGATAFYNEMNQAVLPSVTRLVKAFEAAQRTTLQISQIVKQAEEDAARLFQARAGGEGEKKSGGFWHQVGGFFEGLWEGGKGMVEGLWHAVTHPIDTLKGLAYGITHPGELWEALKKPYVEDWNSGNQGRAIGRGVFEVVMLLIPGIGEAKAVGKGAEVAATAARVAEVSEAARAARLGEIMSTADKISDVSRAAELAGAISKVSEGELLAAKALEASSDAAQIARATDAFASARVALELPDAAGSVARFTNLNAESIPKVLDSFGGSVGRAGDIPTEFADRRITTLGRLAETGPASEAGARILKVPDNAWSQELNALWMREAVSNGDVIHLVSDVTDVTLAGNPRFGGISVYTRELDVALQAGYKRVGDYLIPPSGGPTVPRGVGAVPAAGIVNDRLSDGE